MAFDEQGNDRGDHLIKGQTIVGSKRDSTEINNEDEKKDKEEIPKSQDDQILYVTKKPRWWRQLAGRRGTKGQRKAITRMMQKGFVIPTKMGKYQHEINVSKLFECPPRGQPITLDDILVPMVSDTNGQMRSNEICSLHQKKIALELGFGQGDNIISNASKFPDKCFIGAEIHQPGVGVALMRMENAINDNTFWNEQTWVDENDATTILTNNKKLHSSCLPYDKLRIFPGDGVKLLGFLPENSIDEIYLTHPDPWPKEQDHHWRVIQEETVHLIGKVLKKSGRFYLATDAPVFDEWTVKIFETVMGKAEAGTPKWKIIDPCPNRSQWLPVISKYEGKGIEEGRATATRCWQYLC